MTDPRSNALSPDDALYRVERYSYDQTGRLVSKTDRNDSTTAYTYNLDGNQKDKTEQDGTVTGYLYDSMGRLRQESETGGETISYTYDRFSNRAKMTVSGAEISETSYTYHPNNWLLTEEKRQGDTVETTRYRYDANGNQVYREWEKGSPDETETGTMKFVSDAFQEDVATLETREYNGFNEPVSVCRDGVRIAYRYRPDGLRCGKTIRERNGETNSIVHLWDGQNIVAEVGTTGSVTARYLRGINLIAREQDGANQYYLYNAHGDVVQRTDAWDNVLKNYRYDAFGNEQNPEKLDSNPFRYCGEYFDRETGEIYLRARYYNPAIGRFVSEDPIRDGLNWYTYCGNNPILYIDPLGLKSYIFYDPYGDGPDDSSKAYSLKTAKAFQQQLAKRYGIKKKNIDTEIVLYALKDYNAFKDFWNNTMESDPDAIVFNAHSIYSHMQVTKDPNGKNTHTINIYCNGQAFL